MSPREERRSHDRRRRSPLPPPQARGRRGRRRARGPWMPPVITGLGLGLAFLTGQGPGLPRSSLHSVEGARMLISRICSYRAPEMEREAPRAMGADEARIPASGGETKRAVAAAVQFEYCKVCKLNQNQGRKHRYFPSHVRALSRFLSRFQAKLSDIRFFLKSPSPLRPEHAARNGLWCVFCDADVSEDGCSFVCNNAIHHLASSEHRHNLKHFLWLHGGGMDRVNSLSISEEELLKWEKKCEALKVTAPIVCEKDSGRLRSSKDIHHEFSYVNKGSVDNSLKFFKPSISPGVTPLQSLTNEVSLGSPSGSSGISHFSAAGPGKFLPFMGLRKDAVMENAEPSGSKMNYWIDGQTTLLDVQNPGCFPSRNILQDCKTVSGGESSNGNVINFPKGARPPWLEENEEFDMASQENAISSTNSSRKSKLNPKRVGAAWAEKRKAELEREKRGELVADDYDANWLPNFGRVWQEGTRKETRKEFEMEKEKSHGADRQQHGISIVLQPYISKRMRVDKADVEVNDDV